MVQIPSHLNSCSLTRSFACVQLQWCIFCNNSWKFTLGVQVIDYYKKKNIVAELHAEKPPQEVTAEVQKVLSWDGSFVTSLVLASGRMFLRSVYRSFFGFSMIFICCMMRWKTCRKELNHHSPFEAFDQVYK